MSKITFSLPLIRPWRLNCICRNKKDYRKIPKISPGAYFLSEALFEGLIFGGAYIRRGVSTEEKCVSKSIGLAWLIAGSRFTVFAQLFYFVFEGNFPSTSPRGLIFGGAI